jgi:thioredoxin reductase
MENSWRDSDVFTALARSESGTRGNNIVIIGGGLAAFFTAYNILLRGGHATIVADHTNVPCSAGNQIDYRIDGYFQDDMSADQGMQGMLRSARDDIECMLLREGANCRFHPGYEVKARTSEDIERAQAMLHRAGILTEGFNNASQIFKYPDHPHSLRVQGMGQVNMPEVLEIVKQAVIRMGGDVRLGTLYMNHTRRADGMYEIKTDHGVIVNAHSPLIATGAEHMHQALGAALPGRKLVYTAAAVIGPLSETDKLCVASEPMAFCDSLVEGDFVWGTLDPLNMLTIGCVELEENYKPDVKQALD